MSKKVLDFKDGTKKLGIAELQNCICPKVGKRQAQKEVGKEAGTRGKLARRKRKQEAADEGAGTRGSSKSKRKPLKRAAK